MNSYAIIRPGHLSLHTKSTRNKDICIPVALIMAIIILFLFFICRNLNFDQGTLYIRTPYVKLFL